MSRAAIAVVGLSTLIRSETEPVPLIRRSSRSGADRNTARPGTQAEVFGWLSTAIVVGVAAGAAVGGSLITRSGTSASILLGVAGALAAVAVVMLPRPAR